MSIASGITIAAVAWDASIKIATFIREIREQPQEIQELVERANSLRTVIKEVNTILGPGRASTDHLRNLVIDTTARCDKDLAKFEKELERLLERPDRWTRGWWLRVAAPTFSRIEKAIDGHHKSLSLLLDLQHG